MATTVFVNSTDYGVTDSATPVPLGIVEVPLGSVVLCGVLVMAVRSDGASKVWTFDSAVRRTTGGFTILETIPAALNVFATAGDETALTGVAISLYSDTTYGHIGVNCTGQAGQTINWLVIFKGEGLQA
jgi:hypothetical protein